MTTADELMRRAVALADAGASTDVAVEALLDCCSGKRVSVVLARQGLVDRLAADPADAAAERAVELLDVVLGQDVWDVA